MAQIKKNMSNIEKKHGAALTSVSSAASNKRQVCSPASPARHRDEATGA
jgi:hypothetical protein